MTPHLWRYGHLHRIFGSYLIQIARSFTMVKVSDRLDRRIPPMLFDMNGVTKNQLVGLREKLQETPIFHG